MNLYLMIGVMILATNLVRILPLLLIKGEITSPFIRSFLHYVPYVTLSVMSFPGILYETGHLATGIFAFLVAVLAAWKGKSLFTVSVLTCISVFCAEFLIYR